MRIILHQKLFSILENLDDSLESGFFLLGFEVGDEILVYDLVEFNYLARSSVFVASKPTQRGLLELYTIPGSKIVGVLHTHPFARGEPSPSQTDLSDLERLYKGVFLIMSRDLMFFCTFKDGEEVRKCEVTFAELPKLREAEIPLSSILYIDVPSPLFAAEELRKIGMALRFSRDSYEPLYLIDIRPVGYSLPLRVRVSARSLSRLPALLSMALATECSELHEEINIGNLESFLKGCGLELLAVRKIAEGGREKEEAKGKGD